MKWILPFLLLFAACHASRKGSPTRLPEKPAVNKLEGNWELQMLFASDNRWIKKPVIRFDLAEKRFSGNSGCNSISGGFTLKDSYLSFDKNIISTKMACADAKGNRDEQAFLSALQKINTWLVVNDGLELGQGEIVLMKFRKN